MKRNKKIITFLFFISIIFLTVETKLALAGSGEVKLGDYVYYHEFHYLFSQPEDKASFVVFDIPGYLQGSIGNDIYAISARVHDEYGLVDDARPEINALPRNVYNCKSDSTVAPNFCQKLISACFKSCRLGDSVIDDISVNGTELDAGKDPLLPRCYDLDQMGESPAGDPEFACSTNFAKIEIDRAVDKLEEQLDKKCSDAGLDIGICREYINGFNGNEAQIDNGIRYLLEDSNNAAGSGSSSCDQAAGALTLAQIMECSSSTAPGSTNTNTISAGVSNSADNQGAATNKTSGPQVEVSFSADSFQEGSIVTADAVPGFFNNNSDPSGLYFTWYLKREGCHLSDGTEKDENGSRLHPTSEKEVSCDEDKDNKVTENDWKIAAARINVKGSFDSRDVNYGSDDEIVPGGSAAVPSLSKWSGEEEDSETIPNCYVKENLTGNFYELMTVTRDAIEDCKTGYHRACVKKTQALTCDVLNPNFSQIDKLFKENQPGPDNEYKIDLKNSITLGSFCSVDKNTDSTTLNKNSETQKCETDGDIANFQTKVVCNDDNEVAMCVKNDNANTLFPETVSSTNPAKAAVFVGQPSCSLFFKTNTDSTLGVSLLAERDVTYSNIINQDCATTKTKMTDAANGGDQSLEIKCGFSKKLNKCEHLFPETKISGIKSGDGKLTAKEKEFWKANPAVESTNGSGKKDEEVIMGLGVDQFKWMFSTGDRVGVVVEGDSAFASEHIDASFKRMWAFSNGVCKKLDTIKDPGFYKEGSGASERGFLTTEFDLDNCLAGGLMKPNESLASVNVDLTVSPTNPINDENGDGSVLNVAANESNIANPQGLMYEWTVQKSNNIPNNDTSWADITEDITTTAGHKRSFTADSLTGLGKNKLDIDLNIANSIVKGSSSSSLPAFFYLMITAKAKSVGGIDGVQNVEGNIIVRVRQQRNEIVVYPVLATTAGMLSMNADEERCVNNDGKPNPTCYVKKNQIVGVEIPVKANSNISTSTPIAWTVNGENISCNSSISAECGSKKNILFFPVLGNVGEAVDIVATGVDSSNETFAVRRHFVIGSSKLRIEPIRSDSSVACGGTCLDYNNACPKYLGKYIDLISTEADVLDCSADVWQTATGRTVTVQTTSATGGLDWSIDGQMMFKDQQQIEIPIEKVTGDSYDIALSSYISPQMATETNNLRRALYLHWGISPAESVEENEYQSVSIQLEVIDDPSVGVATEKPSIFSASLITHLPEQLMFLLKISLTSILLFLVTGLLFAFIPENVFKEERIN